MHITQTLRFSGTAVLAMACLLLSACTTVPEQIQGDYSQVSPARVEPGVYGTEVRWGGVILDTKLNSDETCFEILSRNLDKYLRPKVEDQTAGRYIACKNGFHDPEVFTKGREITLTGTIEDIEVRQVDEFDYRYPVLDVNQLVLWETRQDVMVYDHMGDPFYRPYYWGWGYGYGWGYPYYGGYPHRSRTYAYRRQLLPDPAIIESRGPSKTQ